MELLHSALVKKSPNTNLQTALVAGSTTGHLDLARTATLQTFTNTNQKLVVIQGTGNKVQNKASKEYQNTTQTLKVQAPQNTAQKLALKALQNMAPKPPVKLYQNTANHLPVKGLQNTFPKPAIQSPQTKDRNQAVIQIQKTNTVQKPATYQLKTLSNNPKIVAK